MRTTSGHQKPPPLESKPLIGIGSCLAGHAVRYNGEANPPNEYVREICAQFETRAFCPEVGIGLGVPRPPIHLVGSAHAVRVLDMQTHSRDYTDALRAYAQQVVTQAPQLCGYILVKSSPSCGYGRVKRYSPAGEFLAADQHGIFAAALAKADPLLPLEDDDRLGDASLRDSFVTRVRTYHDWKALQRQGLTARRLTAFYLRRLVQAHHVPAYQALGPLLANTSRQPLDELAATVISTLMAALSAP